MRESERCLTWYESDLLDRVVINFWHYGIVEPFSFSDGDSFPENHWSILRFVNRSTWWFTFFVVFFLVNSKLSNDRALHFCFWTEKRPNMTFHDLVKKSPKTCFWTRLRDVSCPFDLIWIRGYVCSEKAFAYGNIATCQTVPLMRQWFNTKSPVVFIRKNLPQQRTATKFWKHALNF